MKTSFLFNLNLRFLYKGKDRQGEGFSLLSFWDANGLLEKNVSTDMLSIRNSNINMASSFSFLLRDPTLLTVFLYNVPCVVNDFCSAGF